MPIDPLDVGRTYESIIRINSQSGKGGVAYILEENFGYQLPKTMHPEIGKLVQIKSDAKGIELSSDEIFEVFKENYLDIEEKIKLLDFTLTSKNSISKCQLKYLYNSKEFISEGEGNGPIDACRKALKKDFEFDFMIQSYSEHSLGDKSTAKAIAYIEIVHNKESTFGVGVDNDIATASIKALFCALNRAF